MIYAIPKQPLKESDMRLSEFVEKYCSTNVEYYFDDLNDTFEALAEKGEIIKKGVDGEVILRVESIDQIFGNEEFQTIKNIRVNVRDYTGNYTAYNLDGSPLGDLQLRSGQKDYGWFIPSPFDGGKKYRRKVMIVASLSPKKKSHDKTATTLVT